MNLGVEIGGTKLQLALYELCEMVGHWRAAIDPGRGSDGILQSLELGLAELGLPGRLESAGIGFGGPVETKTGRVLASHQVGGWADFPLADWLAARLSIPTFLMNDADADALAEAAFGAGRGRGPLLYVTVGSGVGGGFVVHDEIYTGSGRGAAELGHLSVTVRGESGTVESFAAGWSIARRAGTATAVEAFALAEAGNRAAKQAIDDAVEALSFGLSQAILLLCPKSIVLGGGVTLAPPAAFLEPVARRVAELTFPAFQGLTDIRPAELGEMAVPRGAAEFARRKLTVTP